MFDRFCTRVLLSMIDPTYLQWTKTVEKTISQVIEENYSYNKRDSENESHHTGGYRIITQVATHRVEDNHY